MLQSFFLLFVCCLFVGFFFFFFFFLFVVCLLFVCCLFVDFFFFFFFFFFGKQFHSYLFGHAFTLVTDHKPLLGLLGESKAISPQASARIHRWALFLAMYEYTLKFCNTTVHGNADALSRLPLLVVPAMWKNLLSWHC